MVDDLLLEGIRSLAMLDNVYPLLARQIVEDYGIAHGIGLDVGCGSGDVGVELARRTELCIYLVDVDREAIRGAKERVRDTGLAGRGFPLLADVCHMPFPDRFADLIVSRGSIFFWENKVGGLQEIRRVLRPGGVALVGGGPGRHLSGESRREFIADRERSLVQRGPEAIEEWRRMRSSSYFTELLRQAGVRRFKVIPDPPGVWAEIRKT